jgi:aminoglycoside phosphotransferase (APT) family kinase protein
MKIDDPLKVIDKKRVASMCQLAGLPRPEAVTSLRPPGRTALYGVRFKANANLAPQILRLDMMRNAHGHPADHWVAANQVLTRIGLPARPALHRFPDHVFGRPAVLYPHVELSTGARLVALDSDFWTTTARDLGKALVELAYFPQEHFGLRASDGVFHPFRGDWASEWIAHSARLLSGARAVGVDLGPLSTALHEFVVERRDALATADTFGLVHGELKPSSLLYAIENGVPALVAIDGWDVAMLGDPLVDVGYLLTYPPDTLAPVLEGVGHEQVESWLEPDVLARIEAYHAAVCATRPFYVAEQIRAVGGSKVLDALEAARQHAEQALQPGFVEGRIRAALELTGPFGPPQTDPAPPAALAKVRSAVSFVRGDDGITPDKAPIFVTALGAAVLATDIESDPLRATAALEAATALLGVVENRGASARIQPVEDVEAWLRALAGDMAEASRKSTCSTSGLLLVWLLAEARHRLGDTLSSSVLRGLELTTREVAIKERAIEPNRQLQAQHAIYGLAACKRLAALGVGDFEDVADVLRERLLDLIDPVEAASLPGGSGDANLLPMVADPGASAEQRLVRPLLILALRAVRGEPLPATEIAVMKWMGG